MSSNQVPPDQILKGIDARPAKIPARVYTTVKFVDIDISVQLGVSVHKLPKPANARAFAFVTQDKLLRGTSAAKDKFVCRVAFECDPGAPLEEFQLVTVAADVAATRLSNGPAELQLIDIIDHPRDHRPIGVYVVVGMQEWERAKREEEALAAWREIGVDPPGVAAAGETPA